MLVVGKPQALPQAFGILLDHDGERRQTPDRNRLFPVDGSHAIEASELRRAAEKPREEAVLGQDADRLLSPPRDEELQQLVPDPLLREDRQSVPLGSRSGEALRVGIAFGIFRVEAEEAHDPQVILADAGMRIADEAHAPGGEIRHAVRYSRKAARRDRARGR